MCWKNLYAGAKEVIMHDSAITNFSGLAWPWGQRYSVSLKYFMILKLMFVSYPCPCVPSNVLILH